MKLTAVSLTAALLSAGPPPASPASGAPAAADSPRTVTLITGDHVRVTGDSVQVTPGEGRSSVAFSTQKIGGRLRVVPADAFAALGSGRLDPRLFDVSTLLEYGYDDRRADLPLIIGGSDARSLTAPRGATVTRRLPAVNGMAVRQSKREGARAWKDLRGALATKTTRIWLDGKAVLSLDESVKQIGAPAAWEKGFTGTGVKVAILDSGVDDTHPDLAGKVTARKNFTGDGTDADLTGHGTHVASTVAGGGVASGGRYRGVAPGATLLDAKVCPTRMCEESAILAGMQWAAEQGARVANLSIGRPEMPGFDPLEEAVQTLTEQYGMLFVVAAGNYGKQGTVTSPATADAALAVGAVDGADQLARFSSQGPRASDGGLKPDITAPGVAIMAARSKDLAGEGPYTEMSGTSMAAPHVAGAAAIAAGQHPDWTAEQLKAALMAAARPQPGTGVHAQGAGRVDVARAIAQTVTTTPSSLGFGRQAWPHGDDQPITKKLSYRNAGSAPVTLRLAMRGDAAVFAVTPETVTVPAGGQAEVSVTADTRGGSPDGLTGAYLEATADGVIVTGTPVAVDKEVQSYDLTLRGADPNGLTTILRTDVDTRDLNPVTVLPEADGTATVRLPKGTYTVDSKTLGDQGLTMLVGPGLRLEADRTVTLDQNAARPVSIDPPDPAAAHLLTEVTYSGVALDGRPYYLGAMVTMFDPKPRIRTAQIGAERPGDLRTKVSGQWAIPDPDGGLTGSATSYRLAWFLHGQVPTGFTKQVERKDLAAVRRSYAVQRAGATVSIASGAWPAGGTFFNTLFVTEFAGPFTHTEYVNTDGGIRWKHFMMEIAENSGGDTTSAATRYEAGRAYVEQWNRGVFGPALVNDMDEPVVTRAGDVVTAAPELYADGAGRTGLSEATKARIALYRDGQLVAEVPDLYARFTVPSAAARYRLVAESERGPEPASSIRTSIAWTFRSAAGTDGPLPLSVIGFAPPLDERNTAPAGKAYAVPVTVRAQPGSAAGTVRALTVDVSYDDGATWQKAPVAGGVVLLRHPAAAGFVSLRARATTASGGTTDQTIIRAYRIA
ncbi:S8 family serine peptidase [Streptosporangium sp. NBC_01756]|uniref:S8 family serine peptidase n=1 Tax=Streptosporangium sp. NBC_01756 TaxID=2975950 RepID=UPI002DD89FA5|nr:S8 family serine peptidase [Streptosporangium sp. NBC_01756]WSC84401.1 S8 family serine peptidase [Streptosporangium sp. NBC_01756]